jgi:hypothetical protein
MPRLDAHLLSCVTGVRGVGVQSDVPILGTFLLHCLQHLHHHLATSRLCIFIGVLSYTLRPPKWARVPTCLYYSHLPQKVDTNVRATLFVRIATHCITLHALHSCNLRRNMYDQFKITIQYNNTIVQHIFKSHQQAGNNSSGFHSLAARAHRNVVQTPCAQTRPCITTP